jgi:hypothetical protein
MRHAHDSQLASQPITFKADAALAHALPTTHIGPTVPGTYQIHIVDVGMGLSIKSADLHAASGGNAAREARLNTCHCNDINIA